MAGIGHLLRDSLWLLVAVLVLSSQMVLVISQTDPLPIEDVLTDQPGTETPTTTSTTTTASTTATTPTTIASTSEEPKDDNEDKVKALTIAVIILGVIAAIAIGIIIVGSVWYWRRKQGAGSDARDPESVVRTIPAKANDKSTLQKVRKYLPGKKEKEATKLETSPTTPASDHPTATATDSVDTTYDPVTVPEESILKQHYSNVRKAEKVESIYANESQGVTDEAGDIYSDADEGPRPVNLSTTSGPLSATQAPGQGGPARQDGGYVNVTSQERGRGDYSSLEDGTKYESHHYTGLKTKAE